MSKLIKILEEQFERYKDIQMQDIYKLIYQGTFGCEHTVNEKSRELLYEEYENADPRKDGKIIELISPYFPIYRINLRPCKAYGICKETLFEWFYESSKINMADSVPYFLLGWIELGELLKACDYIPVEEFEKFEKTLKNGLPVMHHSEEYTSSNNPSYRVVNLFAINDFMERNIG